MKTLALSLMTVLVSSPAFADISLKLSCAPTTPSHHEMPAAGIYMGGSIILLGNGIAQAKIDTLSSVDNEGTIRVYDSQVSRVGVARYEEGEGATGISLSEIGSALVEQVSVTVEGSMISMTAARTSLGNISIELNEQSKSASDVICQISKE